MKPYPRRKSRKKLKRLTAHVKRRFNERFGLEANRALRLQILRMIWAGETELVRRQSRTRSVHRLTVAGQLIDVVYDRGRRALITCLRPVERGGGRGNTEKERRENGDGDVDGKRLEGERGGGESGGDHR